jgi:hypothetical protein
VTRLNNSAALAVGSSDIGGIILCSHDNGKSWSLVKTTSNSLWSITSRYLSEQWHIIASDNSGYIHRSKDSGTSWEYLATTANATILYGTSIGINGYGFVAGTDYVAYTTSITASVPTWIESIPDFALTYFDIRYVCFVNFLLYDLMCCLYYAYLVHTMESISSQSVPLGIFIIQPHQQLHG